MRSSTRFGLLALLLQTALPQTQPDVKEILKKVSATYKAASEYEFVAEPKQHDGGTSTGAAGRAVLAFKPPNRYRIEGASFTPLGDGIIVHDGSSVWFYLRKSNQYGSFPAAALSADAPGDLGDLRPEAVDHFLMSRYREAEEAAPSAKFLREEVIDHAGAKVNCYVLSISAPKGSSTYTWWVDAKRYLILREDHDAASSVFIEIKFGPLPDSLFKFEPPPGAEKVEMQR